ncbi:hypothetical protein TD95_003223 [Thielaviopsis punctulata]|uniref:FAD-binding domain-containing protein n=1 Tax=Thielaviopsis punctulata TaxID=72032 RepID=A0A0F4ZEE9_9PEZI|nr:hypothetical protein TD95_003223 [Thielaviopsis punctulata]
MTIQISDTVNVDVTIVGGGPTGLLTGYLAQRLGVNVLILDSKEASLVVGRADALNARTQQNLELVGILDELLPEGITCNTSSTFANGQFTSRQSHWWNSLPYTYRKNFLMLGQPLVEAALSSRLGASVCYNEPVTSIHEDADSVTVTTAAGRTIRSRYAVAADGARSTARTQLGIDFTGTKPGMRWAVLDAFIDTDFPVCNEIVTFQLNGQSRVSWIPRERELGRFYVLLEDGVEITEENAKVSIREHMAPYRVEFTRTEWFIKERIASTFVTKKGHGRILLGGDAAHIHSVNGGQGLNTGIADAMALAWRLAAITTNPDLSPSATTALIKSYDIERRKTAEGVIGVAAVLVRDTIQLAKKYVGTIEKNAGYITGMGVAYAGMESPLVSEGEAGVWVGGVRCPDLYMMPAGQERAKRVYALTSGQYGRFLVFKVGGKKLTGDLPLGSKRVRVFHVLPVGVEVPPATEKDIVAETFSGDWVKASDDYTVVVRPDMYTGYVAKVSDDSEGWREYLQRYI